MPPAGERVCRRSLACMPGWTPGADRTPGAGNPSQQARQPGAVGGGAQALLRKHANDINSRSSLQGVLLRVEQLAEGEMRRMYGPGHDTIAIEDLGLLGEHDDPGGWP
jgi:hypothetical protein